MQLSQRIVVVDDERSVRSGLSNLLQSEGYATQAFESAEALLADETALKDAALFIIDVELKGMSGFELFRALVQRRANPPGIIISGNGDVIEPEHDLVAIGSGGSYAQAAARALLENTELTAREIVERSLHIAADICIYTNRSLVIEELRS